MPRTIGYHLVKSAYGMWLPGDMRGHWSSAWDEQIGYYQPHHLHAGDPIRERMAKERQKYPATRYTPQIIEEIAAAIGECASESDWSVEAAAIEPTHMHLLLTYSERDIDGTMKWIAQRTTKRVHKATSFSNPVWCEGRWREYIYDLDHWTNCGNTSSGTTCEVDCCRSRGIGLRRYLVRQRRPAIPSPALCKCKGTFKRRQSFTN